MISHNCKNFNTIFENNVQLCENNVQLKDILNGFSILSDIVINKIDNISGDNTILNKIRDYGTIRNINDYSEYKCPLCGKKEVLHFHKTYERNLIFYYNDCEIICRIDIIVLECSYCKEHNKDKQHYHALLPSFILPYHIYSSYIIMDTLYYGLTKEQFNKMLEERNISYQLYYKWLRGLDKYKTSASTILLVKNEIIEVIIKIKEDMYKFLSEFYLSYHHPFFLFKLTCVNLVIMP